MAEAEDMSQSVEEKRAVEDLPAPTSGRGGRVIIAVLVVVAILIIAQLITAFLLYSAVIQGGEEHEDDAPTGYISSILRDFPSRADVVFGAFSFDPEISKMRVRLTNGSMALVYSFPTQGQTMIPPDFGFQLPDMQFYDGLPEHHLNEMDSLMITGLQENSDYRIELIWAPTWEVVDEADLSTPVPSGAAPFGSFCGVGVDYSSATATFCGLGGNKSPFGLMIILENSATWGSYIFVNSSDQSGLELESGSDMATNITYRDLLDDGEIDSGDWLFLAGLASGTEYTIRMVWRSTGEMLDYRTFSIPETPQMPAPYVWFDDAKAEGANEANVTLGAYQGPGVPVGGLSSIKLKLWDETDYGLYCFPSVGNQLVRLQGSLSVDIEFVDYDSDGWIDAGDRLLLSGLDSETHYMVAMIWDPSNEILDWEVFFTSTGSVVPTGMVSVSVLSNTEAKAEFSLFSPQVRPTQLKAILVKNLTVEGTYVFVSDDDGPLALSSGTDVGNLTYLDLVDNQKINSGDQLRMTDLAPNSDYLLRIIWSATGDQITADAFSTPA